MQVLEKTRHIDATITGEGTNELRLLIMDLFDNPMVASQVLQFFRLKPCKIAVFSVSCSIAEVIEQLY